MSIEGGHLVDLRLGQSHMIGEGDQMACRKEAETVLQAVQAFEQKIAPGRHVDQHRANFIESVGIQWTTLGMRLTSAPFDRSIKRRCAAFRHQSTS